MIKSTHSTTGAGAGYLEAILNSLVDYAVFTTDKNGLVNTWNTGAE